MSDTQVRPTDRVDNWHPQDTPEALRTLETGPDQLRGRMNLMLIAASVDALAGLHVAHADHKENR